MAQDIFIGLAGNPNCGKTTLFNGLTGSNGYVGNWPGVTVEKKQAHWRKDKSVIFVDLPGIYSLSPYSPEEIVSRDYVVNERPQAVIDLIDVTNLERNLYLTTQILEAGRPVVVGLNMCDLLRANGDKIDDKKLSEILGVQVVEISALKNEGTDKLVEAALEAGKGQAPAPLKCFSAEVEEALQKIGALIANNCSSELNRWFAVKTFERDHEAIAVLKLSSAQKAEIEPIIAAVEEKRRDDAESIITSDRYEWISSVMARCVKKAPKKLSTSEKIDRVVTNRFLGLPIFAVIMVLVYYLSVSWLGQQATDWTNDQLFGDGFLWNPSDISQLNDATDAYNDHHYADQVSGFIAAAEDAGLNTDGVEDAANAYAEDSDNEEANATLDTFEDQAGIADVVAHDVPIHDEDGNFLLDDEDNTVVTHLDKDGNPVLEPGEKLATIESVNFDEFKEALKESAEAPSMEDYGSYVPGIPTMVTNFLDSLGVSPLLKSLIVDGIIGGVGAVLGFVPQMVILFFLLCFLEDCGYMSRVAFIMDRVFRRFGLSGKSFIPLLVSSGCGVPGIMSTRTIENEKDRRMTVMLTTMIPCGAKLPIIALIMGVLIGGEAWWVAPMFYFLGVAAIIISAIMLKKTKAFAGDPAPFVMELPNYHFPSIKSWFLHIWERVSAYIKKAGTVIFAAAVGIWFLSNFGFANWDGGSGAFGWLQGFEGAPDNSIDYSLLAMLGNTLAWIFIPLGTDSWQAAASSLSALIAKENLVSTFGVLYGLGELGENSVSLWGGFANMFTDPSGVLHIGAMCAFVAFNMLDAPCFAAIGTIRRQMNSSKWFWFAILYQCIFAWVVGLIINQLWELIVFGHFGVWTVVAFILIAAMLFQLFRPMPKHLKHEKKELD